MLEGHVTLVVQEPQIVDHHAGNVASAPGKLGGGGRHDLEAVDGSRRMDSVREERPISDVGAHVEDAGDLARAQRLEDEPLAIRLEVVVRGVLVALEETGALAGQEADQPCSSVTGHEAAAHRQRPPEGRTRVR